MHARSKTLGGARRWHRKAPTKARAPKGAPYFISTVSPSLSSYAAARNLLKPPSMSMTGQGARDPAWRVNSAWPCRSGKKHFAAAESSYRLVQVESTLHLTPGSTLMQHEMQSAGDTKSSSIP